MFYAIIFVGAFGADLSNMRPSVSVGPFPNLETCAGAAALFISDFNTKSSEKDFRAACSKTPDIARHPGEPAFDLRMLAAIAGVPFPEDRQ